MESSGQTPNPHGIGHNIPESKWKSWLYIGLMIIAAGVAAYVIWWAAEETTSQQIQLAETPTAAKAPEKSTETPEVTAEVILAGRDHIWELGFLPTKELLFTERRGVVGLLVGGQVRELSGLGDVQARGEGGLTGLAIDPKFAENRYIYTCYNSTKGDIRVVRWVLNAAQTALESRADIITGMPANPSGRHSGCRVIFGPDGFLWVGTGDSAQGDTIPQSPTSLGGKILRVDRDGKAAPSGNMGGAFDPRIFSFGHRNTQAIAFFAAPIKGVPGVSVEHGSYQDDEVNPLSAGNFGWSPGNNYNELGIPMTDKERFPDAIEAWWRSGETTQAPSGAVFLKGTQWKAWEGFLAIAMLKASHLKLLQFDSQNKVASEAQLFKNNFGRLRAAVLGPENALYITTDNGKDDKIVRIIPK